MRESLRYERQLFILQAEIMRIMHHPFLGHLITTAISFLLLIGVVGALLFFGMAFWHWFDEAEQAGNARRRAHGSSASDRLHVAEDAPHNPAHGL